MAIGDKMGLEAVKMLNEVTLPKLVKEIELVVNELHGLLDRLDGIKLLIPPRVK
jgi:hypothetical protein